MQQLEYLSCSIISDFFEKRLKAMCKRNLLQFVDFISFETIFGNTAILAQEVQLQRELALHYHSKLILCVP